MHIIATRDWIKDTLAVDFDPASRTVTGADAERVMATASRWDGYGMLYGTQRVAAKDPLGSLRDFAVMLASMGFDLPDDLAALLPPAEDIPEGAVA